MRVATSLKRLGITVAALIAAGFLALAVVSLLISPDTVREAVKAEIQAVTGLRPVLKGETSVSLFPTGMVSFEDVSLGNQNSDKPALTASRLTARLRILPLLAGRIEVADISLMQPTISITVAENGTSNWSRHLDALAKALKPQFEGVDLFSEIRIVGGVIVIRDLAQKTVESLTDVELSLAWPSISKSFVATGQFVWRKQPLEVTASLNDFALALAGQQSGIKIRLAGAPLKFAFDGTLSHQPTLKIEGTLSADGPSLRNVMKWAEKKDLPEGGFGRFALKAKTNIVGNTIALTGVNIELDGNSAEGVLAYTGTARKTLQGTLAAEGLDLTPYLSSIKLVRGMHDHGWSRSTIAAKSLTEFDLDLRISAAQVTMSGTKLGRTALATNLRDDKLTVTIGESQAFGGTIKGGFTLAKSTEGAQFKSQIQFSDVDLEKCLTEVFAMRRVEGKGNLALAIEATGKSVLGMARSLNGTAKLTATDGAITGVNVENLLKRLERRPLSGGGDFRSGRTPFSALTVALKFTKGHAAIEEMRIEGPAVRMALTGSASIPARELDLSGKAGLVVASNAKAPAFELPFVVQGPWDDPLMLPDPQALIRRSGAAAPLLNAIKNHSLRDIVRSVIERRGAKRPEPVARNQDSDAKAHTAAQGEAVPEQPTSAITAPARK
jgi:AsmA protein